MSKKTNYKNILDAYQEAVNLGPDNDDRITVMQSIEADLMKAGVAAIVAGKKILIEMHEDKIESIMETVVSTGEMTEDQEDEIRLTRGCITILKRQIRICLGIPDEQTQDAYEELNFCANNNPSIREITPIPCEVTSRTSIGVRHFKEFAVEIEATEGNNVVLTIDELEGIISILKENKPQ